MTHQVAKAALNSCFKAWTSKLTINTMKNIVFSFCSFALLIVLFSCVKDNNKDSFDPKEVGGAIITSDGLRVEYEGNSYPPFLQIEDSLFFVLPQEANVSICTISYSKPDAVIQHNGKSGTSVEVDFTDLKNGSPIEIASLNGEVRIGMVVRCLNTNLPVVSVITDNNDSIIDKINWINSSMKILSNGDTIIYENTKIRGRGNATWTEFPKKPYNLKLSEKRHVLGMNKHKRWCLLALWNGFIGNDLMFECTRRAQSFEWSPSGEFVELILNGKYQGLYYLCEQIRVDQNRINIQELSPEDNDYPNVSGGYLLEYDNLFDEPYKFRSPELDLPVNLKSPNDNVSFDQLQYITNYIGTLEKELKKLETGETSHYQDYLDVETFADYMLVLAIVGNYEAYKPRSVFMHKGRDGVDSPAGTISKLKIGPLWDQEIFSSKSIRLWFATNSGGGYYKYLFMDKAFKDLLIRRWEQYKPSLLGENGYEPFLDYLEKIVEKIRYSSERDLKYWGNTKVDFEQQYQNILLDFQNSIFWMDSQMEAFK